MSNEKIIDICNWCEGEIPRADKIYANKIKLLKFQDTELSHINADTILCEILEELGLYKTATEFRKLDKWYS